MINKYKESKWESVIKTNIFSSIVKIINHYQAQKNTRLNLYTELQIARYFNAGHYTMFSLPTGSSNTYNWQSKVRLSIYVIIYRRKSE